MAKIINSGNQNQKSLNECNEKPIKQASILNDVPPEYCADEHDRSINDRTDVSWLEDASNKKTGIGESANCDPMQSGNIVNDLDNPDRNTIVRYAKGLRGADEAVKQLFEDIVVIDEDGKSHPVPIIWASQERAVAAMMQDNVRKDNSLVVDRIKLPMLAIYSSDLQFNQDRYTYHKALDWMRRYRPDRKPGFTTNEKHERDTVFGTARGIPIDVGFTLYAWTLYIEDMNQIIEQLLLKFSPIAYIKVRGVPWETGVKLDSIANNLDVEPGDQNIRVVKYQFNLTAETYIPQPITRRKAVLKTKTNIFNSTKQEEITEVFNRLEDAVEELS
jgi:hypothetical protein